MFKTKSINWVRLGLYTAQRSLKEKELRLLREGKIGEALNYQYVGNRAKELIKQYNGQRN